MNPKISIITPTLNSAATLPLTADLIAKQSIKGIEWIVVDGGSTDGTLEFLDSFNSVQTKVIVEKGSTIYGAMNTGVRHASGDVLHFLNSDDMYVDSRVIQRVIAILDDDGFDFLVSGVLYVDDDLKPTGRSWSPKAPNWWTKNRGWQVPHPGFFITKKLAGAVGEYNTEFKISADFDYTHRAFCLSEKPVFSDHFSVLMYHGGSSSNSLARISGNKDILESLRSRGFKISVLELGFTRFLLKIPQFKDIFKRKKYIELEML